MEPMVKGITPGSLLSIHLKIEGHPAREEQPLHNTCRSKGSLRHLYQRSKLPVGAPNLAYLL
jgi:hypothetical protein